MHDDPRTTPDGPAPDSGPAPEGGPTGPSPSAAGPLAGRTVGVTAARRAEDLIGLLRRRGASVVHAPAMRTVPLPDDRELRAATEDLIERAPDLVVATTAVGFRGWTEAAGGWGLGRPLLDVLGTSEILARGPKVRGAIRAAGLTERWSPGSESLAEVLDHLLARGVDGLRVAVQLHGEPLTDLLAALRDAGADVVAVPVYRWMPPLDLAPLDRLLDAVAARSLDAVTFTSAPAAASLLDRARQRDLLDTVVAALRDEVLAACVGPVTAQPLRRHGIVPATPERFRLGPLVQVLCDELARAERARA